MNDACAVFVTHGPEADFEANVQAVQPQVAAVVVVDNGSGPPTLARLGAIAGIELIANPENRGIATALNQGVARARERGFTWVLTFDQDSRAPAEFVARLRAVADAWAEAPRVALVAPLYRDRHLGRLTSPSGPLPERGPDVVPVSVTATSGNLLRVAAWERLGGFRDDFFIDCVDFEFCLRARRARWRVLEARTIELDHAQGRAERRPWLGRAPVVNDYAASRRYYQARNRLVMYARFGAYDPRWIARDALGYVSELAKLVLFAERRGPKLRAVLAGWFDAVVGRRGPWRGSRGAAG